MNNGRPNSYEGREHPSGMSPAQYTRSFGLTFAKMAKFSDFNVSTLKKIYYRRPDRFECVLRGALILYEEHLEFKKQVRLGNRIDIE